MEVDIFCVVSILNQHSRLVTTRSSSWRTVDIRVKTRT